MANQKSAGLLVFRRRSGNLEFLIAHPGGPFWAKKDSGAWSVPKGLVDDDEDHLATAKREFEEELGQTVQGDFQELSALKQPSGKVVYCWLVEADLDLSNMQSNLFEMEWPPRSGKMESFPEIDRAEYMKPSVCMDKLLVGQRPFILEAMEKLGVSTQGLVPAEQPALL